MGKYLLIATLLLSVDTSRVQHSLHLRELNNKMEQREMLHRDEGSILLVKNSDYVRARAV